MGRALTYLEQLEHVLRAARGTAERQHGELPISTTTLKLPAPALTMLVAGPILRISGLRFLLLG